ncbi:MAG: peptidase M23 [Flavobacteriia bacterium]|nr:MAG: peptidase M23 [Flavobacteriia bacterium]
MGDRFEHLKKKLTNKYRLVIMNEETFEEQVSFKLSRLNVYVVGGVFSIFLIVFTSLLIAYTPLREYVPGYTTADVRSRSVILLDSLEILQEKNLENNLQLNAIKTILSGDIEVEDIKADVDSLVKAEKDTLKMEELLASREDSLFREEIEKADKYNVMPNQIEKHSMVFFAPVTGSITDKFNAKEQHYGIDVAVPKNTPVKAVEDGTVIFAEWSIDTGFVIIVDHGRSIISVYKHNAKLYKKAGDNVKSGEIIAIAGSEGMLSTATHLHFELWYNSYPIDPSQFIQFE